MNYIIELLTAMSLRPVKSPAGRRGGGMVAGMMLTNFMPLGGRCPPTTLGLATAGLIFGSGEVVLDKAICESKCLAESLKCGPPFTSAYERCREKCKEDTCNWFPKGQWARGFFTFEIRI